MNKLKIKSPRGSMTKMLPYFRVPKEDYDTVIALSKKHGLKTSEILRQMVKFSIDNMDSDDGSSRMTTGSIPDEQD